MITVIPIAKPYKLDLLIQQLTTAYGVDTSGWIGPVNNRLSIVVPDGVDPEAAQTVYTNHDPSVLSQNEIALNSIITTAQGAVGVALSALTQAQIKALMAVMLYNQGGVDVATLTVKPLGQWATPRSIR